MQDEAETDSNKMVGKIYISPRVETQQGPLRIASKVIDSEGLHYATVKKEVVLRRTEPGRTEIIAKFMEDSRGPTVLTLQAFSGNTGNPHNTHFSFVGSEIPKLLTFFENIAAEFKGGDKVNITDSELRKLTLSKAQASSLVSENQEVFTEAIESALTKEDVVALGYRKRQVQTFGRLLAERDYFDQVKQAKEIRGDEALWQMFFEKNQWIFGYGRSYFFVTGFENRKLQQVVESHELLNHDKRADGLMMSRGIINSLCFVEIKTHQTKLLDNSPYRAGCWAPSKDLSGAVAQVQGTIAVAMQRLYGMFRLNHEDGTPKGEEIFNFRPRAFIVIGTLSEFVSGYGVNNEQLHSFEIYRNSLTGIEILTFDELYERSEFIIDAAPQRSPVGI